MKDRINQFLSHESITPAEFADKIGVQRSSVSHVLNGRNFPGAIFIQKMLSSYKTLNPRWLLLGEGQMFDIKSNINDPTLFNSEEDLPHSKPYTQTKEPIKNEPLVSPIKTSEMTNKQLVNSVVNSSTNSSKPINSMVSAPINMTLNREMEQIVIFYKDKTFQVYTPST